MVNLSRLASEEIPNLASELAIMKAKLILDRKRSRRRKKIILISMLIALLLLYWFL
jgi:hypothetical protein